MNCPGYLKMGQAGFKLERDHKFGCVTVTAAPLAQDLAHPINLGNGMWVLPCNPFPLTTDLKKYLGTVWTERINNANLVFVATAQSGSPAQDDQQMERLELLAADSLFSVFILGVPSHGSVTRLRGAMLSEGIWISSVDRLGPFVTLSCSAKFEIDRARLERSRKVFAGWRAVSDGGRKAYVRLRKGLRAWRRAVAEAERDASEQLHFFVRSIEAIIKPSIARTRRQFVERLQLFLGRSPQSRDLAAEIYDLRSACEHLNDWEDVLGAHGLQRNDRVALERSFQTELIASYVWERLLGTPSLLSVFKTDGDIDTFWSQRERDRRAAWSAPLDLSDEMKAKYRPLNS